MNIPKGQIVKEKKQKEMKRMKERQAKVKGMQWLENGHSTLMLCSINGCMAMSFSL